MKSASRIDRSSPLWPKLVVVAALCFTAAGLLPLMNVAAWVGRTDLEIEIRILTANGAAPVENADVLLTELQEGPHSVESQEITLQASQGIATHVFTDLMASGTTNSFGQELGFGVNMPWWQVTVMAPDAEPLKLDLLLYMREHKLRVKHLGNGKSKLTVPVYITPDAK
jgi:hypothetical protein